MARQLPLPGMPPASDEHIVNTASIKHRSPFRYPGGKTWLVPRVYQWLMSLPASKQKIFIEPFAGGAIVGLSVAFERLVGHVVLVELDEQVASVWETIINQGEGQWLASKIVTFNLTVESANALLSRKATTIRERAFQTIVRNRINRGGILAPGAGRMKTGENGKGIASRWYPRTLQKRIMDIDAIRERLSFIHGDGLSVIQERLHCPDAIFFIDPPYTAAGKKPGTRLYTCSDIDHEALFRLAYDIRGDFLMTYNDVQEVRTMARQYNFDVRTVAMKNTHHARRTELLIGKDLSWLE